ncbi:hypothetical protein ACQ4WX_01240 [Streptomyces lasalocidi]
MTLYQELCGIARRLPDSTAMVSYDGTAVSYDRFVETTDAIAGTARRRPARLRRRPGAGRSRHLRLRLLRRRQAAVGHRAPGQQGDT